MLEVRKRLNDYDNPDPSKEAKTTLHDFVPTDYEETDEDDHTKESRRRFRTPDHLGPQGQALLEDNEGHLVAQQNEGFEMQERSNSSETIPEEPNHFK